MLDIYSLLSRNLEINFFLFYFYFIIRILLEYDFHFEKWIFIVTSILSVHLFLLCMMKGLDGIKKICNNRKRPMEFDLLLFMPLFFYAFVNLFISMLLAIHFYITVIDMILLCTEFVFNLIIFIKSLQKRNQTNNMSFRFQSSVIKFFLHILSVKCDMGIFFICRLRYLSCRSYIFSRLDEKRE